ncbi:MAG TPA: PQQ-binding-like beta-propeller repeat protein, partial [Armatimonadota bacterium]|nr:PQQ-binding-like beta-propeller repeat protein [Armatimonadota bacterium]
MEFGLRRAVSICGLAVLGVVSFCPVHAQVVGWRGDGTGRYLDVTPPFKWGRVATSILQLRGQAARPGDGETGQPIPHGSLREWMVLGPCPVPKGLTDFDGEVLEGEADFSPAVGDVTAEMEWEKVTLRTATLDFRAILGDSVMEAEADPSAAYACGWLHSEAGGDVALTAMTGAADLKMWVNGEPPEFGPYRSVMTVEPGWNRILIRSVSSPGADHGSWYVRPLFYGAVGSEYETDNIAWATRMPAPGVGSPIVVGDKVFVTADTCNLLCVDKLTGQILWVRSATYLDAGTDAERAAAPEVFAKIDPWADRLAEINQDLASAAATAEDFRKEKAELETRIHREMKKVDSERYSLPHAGEAGMAPMTPVSDGEHVWVLFATCTLACYVLEGNLVWAALETGTPGEHGHTSSPLLIDGKIITY